MRNQPVSKRITAVLLLLLVSYMASACGQSAVTAAGSSAPSVSAVPAKGFPMDPKAFQDLYRIQLDWIPSTILDYDEESKHSGDTDNGKTKWIVVSVDGSAIEVNEVEWVEDGREPNGFRIADTSAGTKMVSLSNDAGIWLMYESAPLYRIPVSDLPSYIQSAYGKDTLWNYKMRDGKVELMIQQYLP